MQTPISLPQEPKITEKASSLSFPIGAICVDGGVNFSIFSREAASVELLLFNHEEDAKPSRVIRFNPYKRSYHYWHEFVPGISAGQLYGYRIEGPSAPERGLR